MLLAVGGIHLVEGDCAPQNPMPSLILSHADHCPYGLALKNPVMQQSNPHSAQPGRLPPSRGARAHCSTRPASHHQAPLACQSFDSFSAHWCMPVPRIKLSLSSSLSSTPVSRAVSPTLHPFIQPPSDAMLRWRGSSSQMSSRPPRTPMAELTSIPNKAKEIKSRTFRLLLSYKNPKSFKVGYWRTTKGIGPPKLHHVTQEPRLCCHNHGRPFQRP